MYSLVILPHPSPTILPLEGGRPGAPPVRLKGLHEQHQQEGRCEGLL
jgi:hypothetical protein